MTATPSPPAQPPTAPPPPRASGPPPAPPTKKPPKRPVWLIALAALAVSLLSIAVALVSLANARAARNEVADAELLIEALRQADPDNPAPTTSPVAPTTSAPAADGPGQIGAPPQSFNPQAAFTVRYSGEILNPQVTSADDAYLDLDEPRVVFSSNAADLVLERGGFNNPPVINLEASEVTAAEAATPEVTPEDCLEQIRTSPLPPGLDVPAQRGTVLCILTSFSRAAEQGISQKLVVLHVSALGDEGRVTVSLNAWEQPS